VLKWSDEPRTESIGTEATDADGSGAISGGICEQRYGADRVLPQPGSIVEHIGPPSEEAAKQCR
jgi:hypothetical protein